MKPCDCKSMADVMNMPESGVYYNDNGLLLSPPHVMVSMPGITFKIPMIHFKRFAEWYLEEQNENSNRTT